MLPPPLAEMAAHDFVSLTTFRRSGAPVAAPVWIAVDGNALVVSTPAETGKVKRLRHDPRVELRPCSRRGTVAPDAPVVAARAAVVAPDARSAAVLRTKYTWQYRLITLVEKVVRRGQERVILRITAA